MMYRHGGNTKEEHSAQGVRWKFREDSRREKK